MLEPRYKCVNTIAIRFDDGQRDRDIVKVLLRDIFRLKPSDIGGVGNEGRNSIHVKFTTASVYEYICNNHHGDIIPVNDIEVKLEDVSTYTIKVTMKNIPFEFPNAQLKRILESYGTVRKIVNNAVKDDFFDNVPDTERIAYMDTIYQPIPSTLFVNLIGKPIYFNYPGQTPTCNKCGDPDHSGRDCGVSDRRNKNVYLRPEDRLNSFTLLYEENFPSLLSSASVSPQAGSVVTKLTENASSASYDDAHGAQASPTTSTEEILSETSITPTQENHIDVSTTNKETPDNKKIAETHTQENSPYRETHTQENSPYRDSNKRPTPADKNVSTPNKSLDDNRENNLNVKENQVKIQQQNTVRMYSTVV